MKQIEIRSLDELDRAAEFLCNNLADHRIVALYGGMGAGKTTLVSAIARYLGSEDPVTSPTFSIVNSYDTADGDVIHHFDFYRLNRPEEAFDIGYEEYFYGGGLCLVEWPEKIESLLPDDTLVVHITATSETSRLLTIEE